jgi:uncharacterized membrane protein YdjX (TVP38/TMEM64 family)
VVWWFSDVSLSEVPALMSQRLTQFGLFSAICLALVLYTLRPLVLFPSTVMGVASGLTFGPLIGCLVTLGGEMLGATMAFSVSRILGRGWVTSRASVVLARWDRRLSSNGVLTVSVMRLVLLPFDSVSYACGLTGIPLGRFCLGTLLGGSCYILGVTLLGGSVSVDLVGNIDFLGLSITRRTLVLGLSGLSFLVGLVLAWKLRYQILGRNKGAA